MDHLFNEKRAAQAAAYFAKLHRGKINKYYLCKMLYYLERETIIRTGQPLFFDELYSAPKGPIASEINHGIDSIIKPTTAEKNFQKGKHPLWEDHFNEAKNFNLHLIDDPGDDELSLYNIEMIKEIFNQFIRFTWEELEDYFHNLPEYTKTESSIPISYEDILRGQDFSAEEIDDIISEINYFRLVVSL